MVLAAILCDLARGPEQASRRTGHVRIDLGALPVAMAGQKLCSVSTI